MKVFLKKWFTAIKDKWVSMVVACGVWTLLAYLWQRGVHNGILVVMNYLTGSLLGLDGVNVIGGTIGRSILLVVVNSFFASIFMHKGDFKMRLYYAKKSMLAGLGKLNTYVSSFLVLRTKDIGVIAFGFIGIGLSLCVNTFITGNAEFINSFVNIALFMVCASQIQEKRGFLVACANVVLKKFGYQEVNGAWVIGLLSGITLGCLLAPVTYLLPMNGVSYVIGATLLFVGTIFAMACRTKGEKTA